MTAHLIHLFWSRVFGSETKNNTAMVVSVRSEGGRQRDGKITWNEAGRAVASIVVELRNHGIKKGDRVAILGWNSPEWVWADLAIQTIGGIVVPIYPNNSGEQNAQIIADSGAILAVTADQDQVNKLVRADGTTLLPVALLKDEYGFPLHQRFVSGAKSASPNDAHNNTVVQDAFIAIEMSLHVADKLGAPFAALQDDDIASIIYTSGSTGVPKGCMISHGNIAAVLSGLQAFGFERSSADRYLSYLPMAHVYERYNGMAFAIWNGVPSSFCAVDQVKKGLASFRPTMVCCVPAVLRKIKDSVENPEDGPLKVLDSLNLLKPLLAWAFAQEVGTFKHKLVDRLLFAKIRARLGGALELLVSGGAPCSPEVINFFRKLGLVVLEGYGLSETTGGITINRPNVPGLPVRSKVGSVGQILPGAEVRIVFEDGETAFGEIYLRGKQIFKGYWNRPEETAEVFTEDGWFKTGDNGSVDLDGFVYVMGRKNGNYKTEGGKFVPKEKLEKAFEEYSVVHYVVPVAHGRKFATALIFVNQINARKLIGRAVPEGVDAITYLAEQPEVRKAIEAAVEGANAKLERWEQVKKFRILAVEAQVANGLLTPTLKMRTKEAFARFKNEIEEFYAPQAR